MSYQFTKYETHYKNLTYLGVPIIIGQLGNLILNFADTLMIGHHSTEELAAAAFVNNMFTLVIIFAIGFTYAVTALVGILYGQENTHRIGELMKSATAEYMYGVVLVIHHDCSLSECSPIRTTRRIITPHPSLFSYSTYFFTFCLLVQYFPPVYRWYHRY